MVIFKFWRFGQLIGLFLVSVSLLMIQILLLRFSRVAFVFNLQFIILSSAILGIGLGAFIVHLWMRKAGDLMIGKYLFRTSFCYSVSSLIPFFVLHFTNFYPLWFIASLFFISELAVYIFAGVIIALTFRYYARSTGIYLIYFINMLGSGVGAFLAIFLLDAIGIYAIIANSIISLAAFLFYSIFYKFSKSIPAFIGIAVFILILFSPQLISYFRVICDPSQPLLRSSINSFSQIDLYGTGKDQTSKINKIILECYIPIYPYYNVSNTPPSNTPLFNFDRPSLEHLNELPYLIKRYDKVAILGSGGGERVAEAVFSNAKSITAIEINPLVIKTVYEVIPDNIYTNKTVKLVLQEARSYMAASSERFDLIYIPGTRKFGSTGLRQFAMQENYLYSREAFSSYINHLTDKGIFAVSDFNGVIPQFLSTLKTSLVEANKNSHNIVLAEGNIRSIIFYKNQGFTEEELSNLNKQVQVLNYRVILDQNIDLPKIDALTFDRPYLMFNKLITFKIGDQAQVKVLRRVLINSSIVLSAVYLIFLWLVSVKSAHIKKTNFILGLFTFTGLGFIGLELYLIEKLSLLLGHPSYSLALALPLLLIFGGVGNLLAKTFQANSAKVIACLVLTLILYLFFIDNLIVVVSPIGFWLRLAIAVPLLVIPSIGAGIIFGICLKMAQSISEKMLPLALAVDGLSSVLGGFLFAVVFLSLSFSAGLSMTIIFYLGALVILRKRY